LSKIGEIAEGYANLVLGQNETLYAKRIEICKTCPMMNKNGTCGKCGCLLQAKLRTENGKCPVGKW
jgi:hypothetical protein